MMGGYEWPYDVLKERADRITELEGQLESVVKSHNELFDNWERASGEAARAEATIERLRAVIASVSEHDRTLGAHIAAAMKARAVGGPG